MSPNYVKRKNREDPKKGKNVIKGMKTREKKRVRERNIQPGDNGNMLGVEATKPQKVPFQDMLMEEHPAVLCKAIRAGSEGVMDSEGGWKEDSGHCEYFERMKKLHESNPEQDAEYWKKFEETHIRNLEHRRNLIAEAKSQLESEGYDFSSGTPILYK